MDIADIDAGRKEGLTTAEREELVRLRRENRVVRMDPAKAAAFFATENGHRPSLSCQLIEAEKANYTVAVRPFRR